jgi:glycerol dehydrogenase-like iron-containing ADH family enzyme
VPLAEHDAEIGGIPGEEHLELIVMSLLIKGNTGEYPYAHAAHVVHAAATVATMTAMVLHGMHVVAVVHCESASTIKGEQNPVL